MQAIIKLSFLVALFLGSLSAQAQKKMTDEQIAEAKARFEAYREKLNLTDEQSEKVKTINENYFTELATLRDSDASRLSKYRQFKSMKSKKDKEMKAVLTKEQFKTYKEFQAEMKDEFMKNRRNG